MTVATVIKSTTQLKLTKKRDKHKKNNERNELNKHNKPAEHLSHQLQKQPAQWRPGRLFKEPFKGSQGSGAWGGNPFGATGSFDRSGHSPGQATVPRSVQLRESLSGSFSEGIIQPHQPAGMGFCFHHGVPGDVHLWYPCTPLFEKASPSI